MFRKIFFVLISLFLLSCSTNLYSADKFYFDNSVAVFRGSEGKSILEIYYAFYQKFLTFTAAGNNLYSGAAGLEVQILDKASNKTLASNVYKIPSEISDTSASAVKNKIIGQITYEVRPAEYQIILIGSDFNNPAKTDTVKIDYTIPDYSSQTVSMSDIELSSGIQKSSDSKNIFYKNTLEVTPNPGGLYGSNVNNLAYYCEIYNLNTLTASPSYFNVSISNVNDEVIYKKENKISKKSRAIVQFGSLMIDSLKSGSYFLTANFIDSASNVSILKKSKFFVFNKSVEENNDRNTSFLRSEFSVMTEKEINEVFDKSIYIRSGEDTKKFNSLTTLESKRKFMYEFWNQKSGVVVGKISYDKVSYFKRVNEANRIFLEPYKEGWKTDRGRIYVLYGPPDDIDRHNFDSDTRSYDVWTYNSLEGGAICVFYEKEINSSLYYLLHSTIRTEIRNNDWQKEVKKF